MASPLETFVSKRFPRSQVVPLSGTNNDVYLVTNDDRVVVVKLVTDRDIPLDYLAKVNQVIAQRLPTQGVREVHLASDEHSIDVVVAEYIDGVDLATTLNSDTESSFDRAAIPSFFVDLLEAMLLVPPLHPGFGLFKRSAQTFVSHGQFIKHYALRYWNRVRPYFDDHVQRSVEQWINNGLTAATADDQPFGVVAIDANLKNFVVATDGSLVLLNVPIVGLSSIAHGVGALSVNLRHHPERSLFLSEVASRLPETRLDLVQHYELWNMLGVLSFYAKRHPDCPESWQNFGSPTPLCDDFVAHLKRNVC
ncbi:MAG: hypothetical protein OXN44_02680 [Acidimicrobiaceae bacterium]|nr:hypothetical protein [Acidimicrobiaceae bacterium]MDE0607160.1 hypothetical protein [Acidimicrobiaceae bacterium]